MFKLACALAAVALAASHELKLVLFDNTVYPKAVCNDGSPAGYYFKPSDSGSNVWVVHQQGGGWCYDQASCAARTGNLISSKGWKSSITMDGLLNATDPRLFNANLVFLPYCSSDAWIGAADSKTVGFPFTFNMLGTSIVDATFAELVGKQGLGHSAGAQLLYSGCSAGARGVLFNLPRVFALVTSLVPQPLGAFGGLLDSAFWLDMAPENSSAVPFAVETQGVFGIANVTGSLDPACIAAYPGPAGWHCLMAEYALPFLTNSTIPFFLYAFQYDMYQLDHNWGLPFGVGPTGAPQLTYAEQFRAATRNTANTEVVTPARHGTAAMLPACFHHCNTEKPTFSSQHTNGVTFETAVATWFFQGGAAPAYVVEDCTGFNCGNQCPS